MPCDLHMEHLNRSIKIMIKGMGGNVSPKAIVKAGKAIGIIRHVCTAFEEKAMNKPLIVTPTLHSIKI